MGISNSTEGSDEDYSGSTTTETTSTTTSSTLVPQKAIEEELLDSTDSEITLEDPRPSGQRQSKDEQNLINDGDNSKATNQLTNKDLEIDLGFNDDCEWDCDCECECNCECVCECDCHCCDNDNDNNKENNNNKNISSEVMYDYQRYSREPPEKDQNLTNCPIPHNMKSCCRNCYGSVKKLDNPHNQSQNSYHHSRYTDNNNNNNIKKQQQMCKSRNVSDQYVAYRNCKPCGDNEKPNQSRSAPVNVPKNKIFAIESRKPSQQHPADIPLPPPPPTKQHSTMKQKRDSFNHINHTQSLDRKNSPRPGPTENPHQMYNQQNYNYNKQQYKSTYPYEGAESAYSHDTSCSQHCGVYDHCPQHRRCKCQCMCETENCYQQNFSDDEMSSSNSTKTDFMNLAYQRTGDYPELVDELENTLSQRNRMRVQKTMQQFEMLSRQNKNLDRPIFDDESVRNNYPRHKGSKECKCACCKGSNENNDNRHHCTNKKSSDTYKTRSEALTKRPGFQPTPFPRNAGYVEKVARYMDPNLTDKTQKYPKSQQQHNIIANNNSNMNTNNNGNPNGNGSWQMDTRKGEWVKVSNHQNHYDFENSYPPLPPRPRSGHYENRNEYSDGSHMDHSCACNKCTRHNR